MSGIMMVPHSPTTWTLNEGDKKVLSIAFFVTNLHPIKPRIIRARAHQTCEINRLFDRSEVLKASNSSPIQVQLSDQKKLEAFGVALAEHCILDWERLFGCVGDEIQECKMQIGKRGMQ